MANAPRFLIGFGERLTEPVSPSLGGGATQSPYDLSQARARLAPQFSQASYNAQQLPQAACPKDRVVSTFTLHPSFISKSYFPAKLLHALRLEVVGSRPRHIVPDFNTHQVRKSNGKPDYQIKPGREERPTTELFVQSTRSDLQSWAIHLENEAEELDEALDRLVIVEAYGLQTSQERLRVPSELPEELLLEIVLHSAGLNANNFVLEAFEAFAQELGVDVNLDRRIAVGGLCFVPALAPSHQLDDLAQFSFMRVARPMPRLRLLEPAGKVIRSFNDIDVSLSSNQPVDSDMRVAVFDGGVKPHSPLSPWVTSWEIPGIGAPLAEYINHGMAVTSALLFGSINSDFALPVPFSYVDHYRVLDDKSDKDPEELYEVLRRIDYVLSQNDYSFVNLSIGPQLPIEDDEVHSWTAFLDAYLADGRTLASIAIGNNGCNDRPSGNARIQVPGDCVNALSVGASNSQGATWERAPYSAFGPGRAPGVVKPDVVAFGGSDVEPFLILTADKSLVATSGTSFASPTALRAALGVRGLFGERLDPLALKALLIHTAELHENDDPHQFGWGRVNSDFEHIVVCGDGMARVVYQGALSAAKYLRAQLPIPNEGLEGYVKITATLVYASVTEPEHPSNYTQSGLEVVFRPDHTRYNSPSSTAAKSSSFFSKKRLASEAELRADAHKWETVLHEVKNKRSSSLNSPVFDIHYNARLGGHDGSFHAPTLRYAMIITVECKNTPDLYDRVLRTYATQLEALVPRIDINMVSRIQI